MYLTLPHNLCAKLWFPWTTTGKQFEPLRFLTCEQYSARSATWDTVWGRKCGIQAVSCDAQLRQCLIRSVKWWLDHIVGPDERRLMIAVTRGKVSIFFRQLLGFQPQSPRQRGRHYDLIPGWSFSTEREEYTEKLISGVTM